MLTQTRSTYYPSTPKRSEKQREASTRTRTRFFDALDRSGGRKSKSAIFKEYAGSRGTGARWEKERQLLGSPAYHRTRPHSKKPLGKPPIATEAVCKKLVSPSNPKRTQSLSAQLAFYDIPVKPRALQIALKKHTNHGKKYKQAYIGKEISKANKKLRKEHGEEHKDKPLIGFWDHVIFTDEAHIDPSAMRTGWILREQGHRYDTENIQERPELTGVKLHVAGWVNWYTKYKKLEFYHNEESRIERPKRPPKPRTRKYESKEEYEQRMREWEATEHHDFESVPKGNSMTQKYYTERLLPVYIKAIQDARIQGSLEDGSEEIGEVDWLLLEDNDGSHGHGRQSKAKPWDPSNPYDFPRPGLATKLKSDNWIGLLRHPPQSPDLNPIEACWNILKQRIQNRE